MIWDGIIFDLDGTLTDSAPGLLTSLRGMHRDMGWPVPSDAELMPWLGPPVRTSLLDRGWDDATAEHALNAFREHLRAGGGLRDSTLYPGIAELLYELRDADVPVALATFKKQVDADAVIDHFDLRSVFRGVHGSLVDVDHHSKAAVITRARESLALPDDARIVMVGDRMHDVESAAELEIPTIGAGYGYGPDGELEGAGAIAIARDVAELRALLTRP